MIKRNRIFQSVVVLGIASACATSKNTESNNDALNSQKQWFLGKNEKNPVNQN
jgi:hypothetical protein